MQDDDARMAVVNEFKPEPGQDNEAAWAEWNELGRQREKAQADQAAQVAAAPSRRAWFQQQKKAIRKQIKVTEAAKGAANLAPSARELYARRHAVLDATLDEDGEVLAVTYLRACTCEKAMPHTPSGRTLTMVPA